VGTRTCSGPGNEHFRFPGHTSDPAALTPTRQLFVLHAPLQLHTPALHPPFYTINYFHFAAKSPHHSSYGLESQIARIVSADVKSSKARCFT
jgi:hypothetical protein